MFAESVQPKARGAMDAYKASLAGFDSFGPSPLRKTSGTGKNFLLDACSRPCAWGTKGVLGRKRASKARLLLFQALVFVLKNSPDASKARTALILLGIIANACSGYALLLFAL